MVTHSIQDRTPEFRAILAQASKRQSAKGGQRQNLLSAAEKNQANGNATTGSKRSEFARNAAQIGRGITATMGKLERLAQLAKRKAIFDDRPVEISELTYVIKQDLAGLNQQISGLQQITQSQHPTASQPRSADQEGQHNKNVVLMLQNKVTDVAANFKDVLEVRTKNIQASRSRTENFVSSVSARSQPQFEATRSESPLYSNTTQTPKKTPYSSTNDLLTLEPSSSSALMGGGGQSDSQLLLMEEAQPTNTYIQERGQAIEAIEKTINELGSIFGQLAGMVQEQGEMLQRIDANTEDVVDNVQGAQRELLKYWNRVQGNRWLVAKMFGVLMVCPNLRNMAWLVLTPSKIFFLLWVLISG
jgi:syntaxin 5